MIINKSNEENIKEIFVHDSIMTDFNYNFSLEKLSLNLISTWKDEGVKDVELIFKGVVMVYFQNAGFWGSGGDEAHAIYIDKDLPYYKKLVEEYNEKSKDYICTPSEDEDNTKLPDKFNDNVMEIAIQTHSGGEIRVLCNELVVIEIA